MRYLFPILLLILVGCKTTDERAYSDYLAEVRAERQQEALERQGIADAAQNCNGDATCVVAVAGFAAMAAQGGGGSMRQIQPYQRQPSAAERVALSVIGALPGLGQVYATIDAGRRSVDVARIGADRDIGIAGHWAGAITGTAEVMGAVTSDVADAFVRLPPTTAVGGDLISGQQHIGDWSSVGRDAIGGDQHVGDRNARDTIGRDRVSDSNIGEDNRLGSPGPWTDDNSGPRCQGELCQGQAPVEPEPDPGG